MEDYIKVLIEGEVGVVCEVDEFDVNGDINIVVIVVVGREKVVIESGMCKKVV